MYSISYLYTRIYTDVQRKKDDFFYEPTDLHEALQTDLCKQRTCMNVNGCIYYSNIERTCTI